MSIYCSRTTIGCEGPDDLPPPVAYLGSHVRIAPDAWRYGTVDTAHIPPWCAHGVDLEEWDGDDGPPAPYMRLSVTGWDRHEQRETNATVLLDEDQVRALRDDFTHWLDSLAGAGEEDGSHA